MHHTRETMTETRTDNVFNMEHPESDTDGEVRGAGQEPNPTMEVMAAVRQELDSNRTQIIDQVKQQALPAIEAAVNRAMKGIATKASTKNKKRSKMQTDFKNRNVFHLAGIPPIRC